MKRGLRKLASLRSRIRNENQGLLSRDKLLEYSPSSCSFILHPLYIVFIHRVTHKEQAVYKRGIFFSRTGKTRHESESARH